MLVLSRRAGEAIVIGEDVRVVVLEVRGEVVRLGIDAPRSVAVHREEVFEQIREENRRAAQSRDALDRLLGALNADPPRPGDPGPDNG
ncbi:carbon storage regulator CsrA [Kyrpidia tusciae]|uniref:Translational regulator CsrA n=1 Tax=Kyrpidia tusciae (strain DSM 2912 / NBRC 15312 / T2) TaxID=562970 RepID=D5WVR8_KYRT2|nr:carbon storage regulator CsrA [Kyrpidia tusciae]ADG07611.1 carbon storage regulator, CsrA [Kyrpidia tusciae DSM 2912]